MFKRTGTSWAEEAKLLASDRATDDQFGVSVSISGDYAVVGAVFDDDNGDGSGSAYVFKGLVSCRAAVAHFSPAPVKLGDVEGWSVCNRGVEIGEGVKSDY